MAPTPDSNTVLTRLASLAGVRARAREAAERHLAELGFSLISGDEAPDTSSSSENCIWRGTIAVSGLPEPLPVEVLLPADFPDSLPNVYVKWKTLPRRVAHLQMDGKLCVVAASGVLIDADRPTALVDEVLAKAAREIARGITGESDDELQSEWLAYWVPTISGQTYSICRADGIARHLVISRITGAAPNPKGFDLMAESLEDASAWAQGLGGSISKSSQALFLPTTVSFAPPMPDTLWTAKEVRALLASICSPHDIGVLDSFLTKSGLPAHIVLSLPEAPKGSGRRLVALRLDGPDRAQAKSAARGFRPGMVPTWRLQQVTGNNEAGRLQLTRVDSDFLVARGAATSGLVNRTVAIVGVGAVGSELAVNLAAMGVGRLRFIDADTLNTANIHRHVLGMRDVGRRKVEALQEHLTGRFPHLRFESVTQTVQDVLIASPGMLLDTDLIAIAVGDETLERRLNRLLAGGPPRVHTWVEPLSIGGHALACNIAQANNDSGVTNVGPGCFECLLVLDPRFGLVNSSAFVGPNQEIMRSLAGCAGSFSPFSATDAKRTAIEAATLIGSVLTGEQGESLLVSWRGDRLDHATANVVLSPRAAVVAPGVTARIRPGTFSRMECEVCGKPAGESHPTPSRPDGGRVE